MFTTIVWATDGSENAARALPYAQALSTGEGAMLVVVHIVQQSADSIAEPSPVAEAGDPDARKSARTLVDELSHDGLNAILKLVELIGPQPAQGIADIAKEVGADVIVVGTRGHSAIGGLLIGSVTQRLIQIATCPVLSVPPAPVAVG